jgi:hypothetical protein
MPGRRFALYFAWSRPKEVGAELGQLENRYPTLFEFRRAIWPHYEWARDPTQYQQNISGFLDHVILFDFQRFSQVILEATGQPVALVQRAEDGPAVRELDGDWLAEIDTLIVISLDHFRTQQRATPGELEALRHFLARENACLVVCPHHEVGAGEEQGSREVEFLHHGDRLVPAQQRIGGLARSLLEGLGFPIENRYGLSPARSVTDNGPAPLLRAEDLDELNILRGVDTFNLHPHLPHLYVPGALHPSVRVLARQLINPQAPRHPFVDAGNRYFNALVWIPPEGRRAGHVFVCDATLWSSAFGGVQSLETFWRNLARLP